MARFDFYDDELISFPSYQVDLSAPGPIITDQDFYSLTLKETGCHPLSISARLPTIFPCGTWSLIPWVKTIAYGADKVRENGEPGDAPPCRIHNSSKNHTWDITDQIAKGFGLVKLLQPQKPQQSTDKFHPHLQQLRALFLNAWQANHPLKLPL
jgi:hypothetical protein